MSQANFNQLCNMLHSTMENPHTHLLSLPYDVRRLIYEYYYPVNEHIHLTFGPVSKKAISEGSIKSRLPPGATGLMRVCKQVNLETTPILYATNTFFMVANEKLYSQPHSISSRWLHNLRIPTRQMVKKLELLVRVPLERSLMMGLLSGVAHFPHLEIRVKGTKIWIMEDDDLLWDKLYDEEYLENQRISLCKGVMRARGTHQTMWIDSGSCYTASAYRKTGITRYPKKLHDSRLKALLCNRHGFKKEYLCWIVDGGDWIRRDKEGSLQEISPPRRLQLGGSRSL